jgi:AcrR family transcriptional regulator
VVYDTRLVDERRDVARARILRAARAVLAERGLTATVDEVAAAAGLNRRTVFRHFSTRYALFAEAIQEGIRRYTVKIPRPPGGDLRGWLVDLLVVVHRLNARNGRAYWELAGLGPGDLPPELAAAAADRRAASTRFATTVTTRMWQARRGRGRPPEWLVDAVAVHLSGFTTQSLTGDFGRTPEEVARVSAQVLEAALAAALAA